MSDKDDAPPPAEAARPKLVYTTPRLVVYGSLAILTSAVGAKSNKDGGAVNGKMMSQ